MQVNGFFRITSLFLSKLVINDSLHVPGGALKAMQDLFEAVVRAGLPGLGYQDILNHLLAPLVSPQAANIHKQVGKSHFFYPFFVQQGFYIKNIFKIFLLQWCADECVYSKEMLFM